MTGVISANLRAFGKILVKEGFTIIKMRGLLYYRHPSRLNVGMGSRVHVVVFIVITNFKMLSISKHCFKAG